MIHRHFKAMCGSGPVIYDDKPAFFIIDKKIYLKARRTHNVMKAPNLMLGFKEEFWCFNNLNLSGKRTLLLRDYFR